MQIRVTTTLVAFAVICIHLSLPIHGQIGLNRRPGTRVRPDKPGVMRDAFYEDNAYIVKIRTTYNQTTSITCNAVAIEEQLVLSDVTCIKYQNMANIDAKYVQVLAGEWSGNETIYSVDAIYLHKSDPRDPGTELAILKLSKPLQVDSECRSLLKPEKSHSVEFETKVRVIGYTQNFELKENRTRVARKSSASKYICTTSAEPYDTPGSSMLRGAPLLVVIDCKQYQLVGILTKLETITETTTSSKKHQDCYVAVSLYMKWFEHVKTLAFLAAKKDNDHHPVPSVMVVSDDDPPSIQEYRPEQYFINGNMTTNSTQDSDSAI